MKLIKRDKWIDSRIAELETQDFSRHEAAKIAVVNNR